ncbi:hypothetical protein [Brevibacterium casei]|uniref:Uncharacterized protein n=1 Tax=Brevibacterium casei TaxID=33889 RepID=A0A7T2TGR0_9MICO|nr:hypothetical protein [Brevibacterium casei]QPS33469.1 hypothetical protein I6G59_16295 [Brevibacterium casei]
MTTETDLNARADRLVELGRRRDHLEAHVNFLAREIAGTAATIGTDTVIFGGRVIDYRNAKAGLADTEREYADLLK